MKNIIAENVVHYGKNRIALRLPYDPKLISIVGGLPPGAKI